jgi:hypothetical protein
MEPLMGAGFSAERAGSADKRIDSVIPFPEEEPALLTKTEDLGFTSLRTGFQRILNPCGPGGTRSAVFSLYRSSLGMGSNADFINVKKTILLKLRI